MTEFEGYDMHDSQEFLSFLIDALHESVNKSHEGRYMAIKDFVPGESEEDYFQMTETYLKSHNNSVVHDLMYGRLRTETSCPNCKHPSLKFDAFNILSLPLASDCVKQYCFFVGQHKIYELTKVYFTVNNTEDLRILQTKVCGENALNLPKEVVSFYQFNKKSLTFERIADYKFDFQKYGANSDVFLFLVHDAIDLLQPNPSDAVQAYIRVKDADPKKTYGIHKPVMVSRQLSLKALYQFVLDCLKEAEPTMLANRTIESDFSSISRSSTGSPFSVCINDLEMAYSENSTVYFKGGEQILIKLKDENLQRSKRLTKLPDQDAEMDLNKGTINSLDVCLNLLTHPERLDEQNKWKCGKCKLEQQANIQLTLKTVPPVLMLHLKRFKRDKTFSKNSERIKIPFQGLDMSPYVELHNQRAAQNQLLYDLYGVICHHGTLNKGHYTAMVKNKDKWYYCDDENVTVMPSVNEQAVEEAAYILFYRQRPVASGGRVDSNSVRGSRFDPRRVEVQTAHVEAPEGIQPIRVSQFSLMESAGKKSNRA